MEQKRKYITDKTVKRTSDGKIACEHGKNAKRCKDCGTGYCIHNSRKYDCVICKGEINLSYLFNVCHCPNKSYDQQRKCFNCFDNGCDIKTDICIHRIYKTKCKECGGIGKKSHNYKCKHDKQYGRCKICNIDSFVLNTQRIRIHLAIKNKQKKTIEYLGCNAEEFRKHIESQFLDGMSWDNYGEWEIDHKVPLKYNNPTFEQVQERLHWTNTQPMWKIDNMKKGNRFISH